MTDKTLGVYKLAVDCGRMGSLDAVFVASRGDVAEVMGQEIHFGEILGKHSDVSVKMREDKLYLVSEEPKLVELVLEHGLSTGPNPIHYWKDQQE